MRPACPRTPCALTGTLQVGFTSEDGKKAYVNNITAGASTIFPQGMKRSFHPSGFPVVLSLLVCACLLKQHSTLCTLIVISTAVTFWSFLLVRSKGIAASRFLSQRTSKCLSTLLTMRNLSCCRCPGGALVSDLICRAGLTHYQLNLGCEPAQYVISYNNEEPGTQVGQADC